MTISIIEHMLMEVLGIFLAKVGLKFLSNHVSDLLDVHWAQLTPKEQDWLNDRANPHIEE